jgi:hypothetical protein
VRPIPPAHGRGKPTAVTTAIARDMHAFLGAIGRQIEPGGLIPNGRPGAPHATKEGRPHRDHIPAEQRRVRTPVGNPRTNCVAGRGRSMLVGRSRQPRTNTREMR